MRVGALRRRRCCFLTSLIRRNGVMGGRASVGVPSRKKARFLRRVRSAKRCIAVRVAAEALDDGAMFARITLVAAAALDQQVMVGQSLAVQQRHVEKIKPGAAKRTIEIFASLLSEHARSSVAKARASPRNMLRGN